METGRQLRYNRDWNGNGHFYDSKSALGFDDYGFPAPVIANEILVRQDSFGDNTVDLEECWFEWLQRNPFDVSVARKLKQLYKKRLNDIDQQENPRLWRQIKRKLGVVSSRIDRYRQENFKAPFKG